MKNMNKKDVKTMNKERETEMEFKNFNKMVECTKWCKTHNAKLINITENGFYYTNANGDWYIRYDEM